LKRLQSTVQRSYFLISREKETSKIKLMPKYLKDYVTEFNFLFHQIYMCSTANTDDENQHNLFTTLGTTRGNF
jgi:hypothetical protein